MLLYTNYFHLLCAYIQIFYIFFIFTLLSNISMILFNCRDTVIHLQKGGSYMKIKKLLCLFMTVIVTASAYSSTITTSASFDGTTDYSKAPKTKIGNFTYILKQNTEYGSIKIPYSATVVDIPNTRSIEVPEKIIYNGIEFIVTDIDLDGIKPIYPELPYKYTKVEEIKLPETIYNITELGSFPILKKLNIPKNTIIGRNCVNNNTNSNIWIDCLIYTDDDFYDTHHISYFGNCPKLKLSVDEDNQYYSYKNDFLLSKDGKKIYMSFNNSINMKIPNGVEDISTLGGNGFYHAKNIKLPHTLKAIWSEVFWGAKFTKITFPDSLEKIYTHSFYGSNLKTIKFGKNLTCIGNSAFRECKKLSKITMKSTKKSPRIKRNSFKNTKKGIKFYVKNKKVAKSLKKQLKGSGVKNAKIYIGKTLVYKNVK